ncbi:hypothetical protein BH10PSE1_BH10PSE1_08320 [soil metagenome]
MSKCPGTTPLSDQTLKTSASADFLKGSGEMAGLIRAFDWASTPLGPIRTWPQSLKTATGLLIASPVPIVMLWGEPGVMLYNDAYSIFAGGRHPQLLGSNVREGWPEVAGFNDNVMKVGLAGGTLAYKDQELTLHRTGQPEQVWMDLDYWPVPGEDGEPAGVIATVVETTDRVVADRRRAEANARLELALSAGRGIGTWDWDVTRDRVVADARFARLYGVDPAKAATGAPIAEFFTGVHPDDLPMLQTRIGRALETGETFLAEYRLVQPDGGIRWVVAEGRRTEGAEPGDIRLPGVSSDITERKQVEAKQVALIELNDAIRDLTDPEDIAAASAGVLARTLNVSRAGYGTVDTEAETVTIMRDFNAPGVASIAGTLAFRAHGSYIEDIKRGETVAIADVSLDPRTSSTAEVLRRIGASSFVNMPLVEQGCVVAMVFANHATPRIWTDADLELMREVAGRVRAASERARAEQAVRASEAELRSQGQELSRVNHRLEALLEGSTAERDRLWELSPDLLTVVSYDGRLERINPSWTRALGWDEQTLLTRPYAEILHPDEMESIADLLAGMRANGKPVLLEDRLLTADGQWRSFVWTLSPEPGGERLYGVGRDVTEERAQAAALAQAQEALRQSQKMEAVGQLTGGIAHDFNNLLAGITGSLELLGRRLSEGRLNGMERYIDAAQGSAQRAASLTQRLLAFSRRQTLDPKATDVNRLIGGMEDLIRRSVGPDVEVEVVGAGGLWSTRIDPSQLENALLNLCINARDAMAPDGGRLTIETANKWLDDRAGRERDLPPGQYVSLCVSDTGAGMTPEIQAQVFDPFFTTKPLGQGTGLGLSMIHGFVRQSGGQVRIYSEVGKGTTMCLYLPRFTGEMDATDDAGTVSSGQGGHGETVLVVDDEETVRMLVVEVLTEAGYHVLEAPDGPSGLDILRTDVRIDLLITDVGLPGGMNGRQVADAAREVRPALKVLFITGYAENAAVGNGHLDAGMEVMTKPFVMAALGEKVRDMVER